MILPNSGRVVVELLRTGEKQGQIYLPQRENLKAGENLFIGRIVHAGDSDFTVGDLVLFQEYSMSAVFKDVKRLAEGNATASEMIEPENLHYIISSADIMGTIKE